MVKMADSLAPWMVCVGVKVPKISGRCHISTAQRGYPIFLIIDPMARHMSTPTLTILWASKSAILTITERIYGQKPSFHIVVMSNHKTLIIMKYSHNLKELFFSNK